jgi:hypothetical protein
MIDDNEIKVDFINPASNGLYFRIKCRKNYKVNLFYHHGLYMNFYHPRYSPAMMLLLT